MQPDIQLEINHACIKKVRNAVNKIGLDLHRLTPSSNPAFQLLKALNRFDIDLVLDVGANVGQFASELRSVGYKGNLVSFEPLSAAHMALSEAASRDSRWAVHAQSLACYAKIRFRKTGHKKTSRTCISSAFMDNGKGPFHYSDETFINQ